MKKLAYAGLVVAVLIAAGLIAFYGPLDNEDNNGSRTVETSEQTETEQSTEQTITFSEDGKTVSYNGVEGKDALSILKDQTTVETQSSDYGEFVTAINGVEADSKTEFWAFYVNGKLANEGAGTYQTKDGDKIEWRIDKIE